MDAIFWSGFCLISKNSTNFKFFDHNFLVWVKLRNFSRKRDAFVTNWCSNLSPAKIWKFREFYSQELHPKLCFWDGKFLSQFFIFRHKVPKKCVSAQLLHFEIWPHVKAKTAEIFGIKTNLKVKYLFNGMHQSLELFSIYTTYEDLTFHKYIAMVGFYICCEKLGQTC